MSSQASAPLKTGASYFQFLRRLHFYAGILVGPFILVAALTGAAYSMAPTLEKAIYSQELTAPPSDQQISLTQQIVAANRYMGGNVMPTAVRPAPENGATTRVMYADDSLGTGENRAIFVDPANGNIRGDLPVYGTSGSLPLRTTISKIHSGAYFGEFGRFYSELAASWMWIIAVAGLLMVFQSLHKASIKSKFLKPNDKLKGHLKTLSWHRSVGIWIAIFMLFFSATGITWSQLGGANVASLREALGWQNPVVQASLSGTQQDAANAAHAEHMGGMKHDGFMVMSTDFEKVLQAAQHANIDAAQVEIKAPKGEGFTWTVRELPSTLPTQADSAAVVPSTFEVIDTVEFTDFPLMAKLARWGVDAHMGILFGLPNQLLLLVFAVALTAVILWGYKMWWQRRPKNGFARMGVKPPRGAFKAMPWWAKLIVLVVAVGICWFLPLVAFTLPVFVVLDVLLGYRAKRRG